MKERATRVCDGTSQEHKDAEGIIAFVMDGGGNVETTHERIAVALDLWRNHGGGIRSVDESRYHRARNHARDRIDSTGRPCCGYTLHYRRSGPTSTLALIDPSGSLGSHAGPAIATFRGWVSRERQHQTENQRQTETVESLADHALSVGDKVGYRLMQRVSIAIENDGSIPGSMMAEVEAWLGTLVP
jgi:hypothetical protein